MSRFPPEGRFSEPVGTDHWRQHSQRYQPSKKPRSGLGVAVTMLILLSLLAGAAVVAVRFTPTVFQLLGGSSSSGPLSTGAATVTPLPTPDWRATYFAGVFRLDVPGVLVSTHGYFLQSGNGQGSDFVYTGAATLSPLQQIAATATLTVQYATTVTTVDLCPHGGTPVALGHGTGTTHLTGWQTFSASSPPSVDVRVVLGGLAINIALQGVDPAGTFFSRYGSLWQHILASFTVIRQPDPHAVNPCSGV
jgi:hypothetical protein